MNRACFQPDLDYKGFKDQPGRIASDTALSEKAFNVAKNENYHGYQLRLAFVVYIFFNQKSSGGVISHIQSETLASQSESTIINYTKPGIITRIIQTS